MQFLKGYRPISLMLYMVKKKRNLALDSKEPTFVTRQYQYIIDIANINALLKFTDVLHRIYMDQYQYLSLTVFEGRSVSYLNLT